MSPRLAGLMGIGAGIVFLIVFGTIIHFALQSIPHSQPKAAVPQPTEVSVDVIPEKSAKP